MVPVWHGLGTGCLEAGGCSFGQLEQLEHGRFTANVVSYVACLKSWSARVLVK